MKLLILFCFVLVAVSGSLHNWTLDRDWIRVAVAWSKAKLFEDNSKTIGNSSVVSNSMAGAPVVQTKAGQVEGLVSKTIIGSVSYAGFLGIPYGKPPTGSLRFQAPVPASSWSGVRKATKEGPSCYGFVGNTNPSEDCLSVNVYTPVIPPSTGSKAVMVFIYGGAFLFGSSSPNNYGPDFFIDQDVVLVTLNYRVGPLGFLSFQNSLVPGNAGLKDQILALKWVKENIHNFGGDPNKVTLFGESAGSASTSYLQLSPAAKGLFNRVIMESGTSMNLFGSSDRDLAVKHAFRLGTVVGCDVDSGDLNGLHKCLLSEPAEQLATLGASVITGEELSQLKLFAFTPVVEPNVPGAVLTKNPIDILNSGDFNKVPTIIGVNSVEGMCILPFLKTLDPFGVITQVFCRDLTKFIPPDLHDGVSDSVAADMAKKISNFYFDGNDVGLDQRNNLLKAVTDTQFMIDIQRVTLLLAKHSTTVYNYHFIYEGPFNTLKEQSGLTSTPGACHVDELGYLFSNNFFSSRYDDYSTLSAPHLTIKKMVKLWTNFAKTGSPTPDSNDALLKVTWKPFTESEHNYLEIGPTLQLEKGLKSQNMKFWNDLYQQGLNKRPLPE